MKTCSQNCIYCQLGKDAPPVTERKEYVPIIEVLDELRRKTSEGLEADYITISGSGEPTLNSGLGKLIDGIHDLTDIPVAVITNGTLLSQPDVREACCKADVVLPSLDAGDAETFEKINQPQHTLDFSTFAEGLIQFREEYTGQIWLEVFFCEGVNTSESAVISLKKWIDQINPDKIQINTAVRPVAHPQAVRVEPERLNQIAQTLSPKAEVIADFSKQTMRAGSKAAHQEVLETLRRRPCSLDDLEQGLGIDREDLKKTLDFLECTSKITGEYKGSVKYYKAL
jgi:wyosine [tRNA(Phe)-imidazoG37] synthetase (radical SAM superfamily)